MPYVRRYGPAYQPTRIIWLDASQSNTIIAEPYGGPYPGTTSNWKDSGNLGNNMTATANVFAPYVYSSYVPNITSYVGFSSSNANIYNNDIIIKTPTSVITGFLVLQQGYSYNSTNIMTLFNQLSLTITSSNSISLTNAVGNGIKTVQQIYNYNLPKIMTFVADGTNVQLSINGGTFATAAATVTFPTGPTQIGLQFGGTSNLYEFDYRNPLSSKFASFTGISEFQLYNQTFPLTVIRQMEQSLASKWKITYPQTPNALNVLNIPDIINWLNVTNPLNVYTGLDSLHQISIIGSSEGLSNYQFGNTNAGRPIYYNNQFIDFIAPYTSYLSNVYIYGQGPVTGFTISMVLTASPFTGTQYSNGLIGSYFRVDATLTSNEWQPCIVNNAYGLITCSDDCPFNSNAHFGNSVYVGTNSNDTYLLTATFDSNFNTQMYINGYPFSPCVLSNGYNWVAATLSNLYTGGGGGAGSVNFSIGAVPFTGGNYECCGTRIGETFMYKRILNAGEIATLHSALFTDYGFSNAISTSGLLSWWDASYNGFSNGQPVQLWYPRYGNTIFMNNENSNAIPLYRTWYDNSSSNTLSFIDLNNGTPSLMYGFSNFSPINLSNYSVFIVGTNLISSNNYGNLIQFLGTGGSVVSYSNYTFSYQGNDTHAASNTLSIYSLSINGTTLSNQYVLPNIDTGGSPVSVSSLTGVSNISIGGTYSGGVATYLNNNSIAEILLYNRQLLPGEYTNIYTYLQSKYGFSMRYYPTPETISGLSYWYDPNDINLIPLWQNHAVYYPASYLTTYGPPLFTQLSSNGAFIQLTTIGSNKFVTINSDTTVFTNYNYSNTSSLPTITSNFTFFVVTQGFTNVIGNQGILSLIPYNSDPSVYTSDSLPGGHLYPGYAFNTTSFQVTNYEYNVPGNTSLLFGAFSNIIPGSIPILSNTTYNVNVASNVNITCVSYNSAQQLFNIRSKGSVRETNSNITYAYTASNAPHFMTIGATYVGSNGSVINRMTGNVGEVLYYNRCLDDIEKFCMINYLEQKWINGIGPIAPPPIKVNYNFIISQFNTSNSTYNAYAYNSSNFSINHTQSFNQPSYAVYLNNMWLFTDSSAYIWIQSNTLEYTSNMIKYVFTPYTYTLPLQKNIEFCYLIGHPYYLTTLTDGITGNPLWYSSDLVTWLQYDISSIGTDTYSMAAGNGICILYSQYNINTSSTVHAITDLSIAPTSTDPTSHNVTIVKFSTLLQQFFAGDDVTSTDGTALVVPSTGRTALVVSSDGVTWSSNIIGDTQFNLGFGLFGDFYITNTSGILTYGTTLPAYVFVDTINPVIYFTYELDPTRIASATMYNVTITGETGFLSAQSVGNTIYLLSVSNHFYTMNPSDFYNSTYHLVNTSGVITEGHVGFAVNNNFAIV